MSHSRESGRLYLVQFDAHLHFVDERHGVRLGHGSPMRRVAEKPCVTGLTQLGIRDVSSTAREGYESARRMGSAGITSILAAQLLLNLVGRVLHRRASTSH